MSRKPTVEEMDDRVEDDNGDESAPSPAEVTVLIDGSNVVYGTGFANTPKLERLTAVLEEFSRYPFLVRTIVDAHLRHTIDDREALERMMTEGHVLQAPAKTRADDYLMALAVRRQARGDTVYILTNDTFPLTGASRTVPRVTFMVIPFDGVDEWVFYPPLDALAGAIEQGFLSEPSALGEADIDTAPASEEKEETVEAPPSEPPRIAPDLMETFVGFIATYTPTLRPGDTIPFAHVAGYLHNQFDGDFCTRFGYRKPADLAAALEANGYIAQRLVDQLLHVEVTGRLLEKCRPVPYAEEPPAEMAAAAPAGRPEEMVPGEPDDAGVAQLMGVLSILREEGLFPTSDLIVIKFKAFGMDRPEVERVLGRATDAKRVLKVPTGRSPLYWPAEGRWEAVDPSSRDDPYPPELWAEFKRSLLELPSHQSSAQTRYHLARNLKRVGTPGIASLPLGKVEHMVQLAARTGLIERVETPFGVRLTVSVGF